MDLVTNLISNKLVGQLIDRVISGQMVMQGPDYFVEYYVNRFGGQYADRLHISKNGAGSSPYFMTINPTATPGLNKDLNIMLVLKCDNSLSELGHNSESLYRMEHK